MDIDKVPQDHISTYANNKKAIYATDKEGHYSVIASSGWDVEGQATLQALNELQAQAENAYQAVLLGYKSPLYYHMYAQRMDLTVLAQSVGKFQWVVKRHFKPAIFKRLSAKLLARYSDALGLDISIIQHLPESEEITHANK